MRAPRLKHSVCKLTPEGWAYLVILCFIAAGAILRNVNLLIVTTGMLVVPILFNWRVCATLRGKLKGKRLLPDFVHAGQTANINWSCENNSKKLTAYNVMVHDLIADAAGAVVKPSVFQRVQSLVLKLVSSVFFRSVWPRTAAHACFVPVPANDVVWASYRCHFPARGQHTFSHAVISVSWPFGLISCRTPVHEEDSVFVAPQLGYLRPAWEQKIDSFVAGDEARTRRVGVQDDHFYALRKWRSGDSRKHVHWRSMAKLGYPLVKQFDQPNNRDFALVLDSSRGGRINPATLRNDFEFCRDGDFTIIERVSRANSNRDCGDRTAVDFRSVHSADLCRGHAVPRGRDSGCGSSDRFDDRQIGSKSQRGHSAVLRQFAAQTRMAGASGVGS